MAMENYSLSDIAAATGEGGFGGNGLWLLVILFFLIGMGGNGFGRNSDLGTYATAASQQEILFGQQFQGLNSAINKVGDGLASLGYSQLQQMDANTSSINGNITAEGRALQMQLADCCCGQKEATAQLRYDMANFSAATQSAIHAEGEATRAMLQQNKIEALQGQISQLQLNQALCGVVRYPNSMAYNAGTSPFCGCSACGNV